MDSYIGTDHSSQIYIEGPDYRVICGSALRVNELREKVIPLLEAGYRLEGGVMPDGQGRLYQTLCRDIPGRREG